MGSAHRDPYHSMFDNLSDKLQRAFKNLRGQGVITEENIGEALQEICCQ